MNNSNSHTKIIDLHYNSQTKQIFDFLSDFMTNKFYNIVFELAKKYSIKNGLSISNNYKNIFDSYMDTLTINSKDEEESKNQMFSVFLNHLYESYMKYINNQIISINDFIMSVNISFLPDNYKNDAYIQNKQNLCILFHTLIYNLSKELYIYINNNMNIIILNRIPENAILLKKECIKFLSIIRNELFIKFQKQDDDINLGVVENNLIINSDLYQSLLTENKLYLDKIDRLKHGIHILLQKIKNYKQDNEKLLKLINVLNQKISNKSNKSNDSNIPSSDINSLLNVNNDKLSDTNTNTNTNINTNPDTNDTDTNDTNNTNLNYIQNFSNFNTIDNLNSQNLEKHNNIISQSLNTDTTLSHEQSDLNNLFNDIDSSNISSYNNTEIYSNSLNSKASKINSELESLFSS